MSLEENKDNFIEIIRKVSNATMIVFKSEAGENIYIDKFNPKVSSLFWRLVGTTLEEFMRLTAGEIKKLEEHESSSES